MASCRGGIDFKEVFMLVARMESGPPAVGGGKDWCVHHMDVKSTFLNK